MTALRPGEPVDIVVVGAGMAGITAARASAADGFRVIVVDKGQAVGGRMATRRIDGARFDHGAQHFSARSPEFAALVDELKRQRIVREWYRSASVGRPERGVEVRHTGADGMRGVVDHLAAGLDVRTSVTVERLRYEKQRVIVETTIGDIPTQAVVLTPPVPQIKALLAASVIVVGGGLNADLDHVRYDPCLAVMATLHRSSSLRDGHLAIPGGPVAWIGDNHHKGISAVPAVTIHGSPAFSATYLEAEPEAWVGDLVAAAQPHLGSAVIAATGHRWRFAQPQTTLSSGFAVLDGPAPIVLAGEVFAGARVEGAFASGAAAASELIERLG